MACRYTFSEHESFPCKTLWLNEGYCFVVQRKVFNNSDAIVDLGVGKNMIDSSRYWLRAFGICKGDCLTRQGDYLFNEADGKEKYIEVLFAR